MQLYKDSDNDKGIDVKIENDCRNWKVIPGLRPKVMRVLRSPRASIARNRLARRNDRSIFADRCCPRRRYRESNELRSCFSSSVSIDGRAICNAKKMLYQFTWLRFISADLGEDALRENKIVLPTIFLKTMKFNSFTSKGLNFIVRTLVIEYDRVVHESIRTYGARHWRVVQSAYDIRLNFSVL